MSPLRWTCKSLRQLADALVKQGHQVSHTVVGVLLKAEGFSLQANSKTLEGSSHPDRDAQFAHIARSTAAALAEGEPVISVDTKKKELVGPFRNPGREWRPQGTPEQVRVHDFLIGELGRAVPYGVYDLAANTGWVSVDVDYDTAEFAVQATVTGDGHSATSFTRHSSFDTAHPRPMSPNPNQSPQHPRTLHAPEHDPKRAGHECGPDEVVCRSACRDILRSRENPKIG